ncbi:putative acetyltransferase [Microcella putealis]|uniref:Putative acetyltransferase n=1 Tax=Microcella putealis TaxID=337005 RepID=A0A4V2EXF9_9MICO|nr:GNAT family N-acetyltransferase [Microcella putealis]RZS59350.1 putative acetyltransferase [Microcella putealis]TQM19975.1 putative acetyltransferase [Microcella putealis]
MTGDFRTLPADERSAAALAEQGLRYELVGDDPERHDGFSQAVSRGFYGEQLTAERLGERRPGFADNRSIGVYDDMAAEPLVPVATVDSWTSPLGMPGGSSLESWAISMVTVAPTHRRRGIARALLEGELRTAAAHGSPIAVLTVSESTIYGRYGFGPATWAAELVVDTTRADWVGPTPAGRLHLVSREAVREFGPAIEERARAHGSIATWGGFWDRQLGLRPSDASSAASIRAVRYDDEAGAPQGFAVYRVKDSGPDFTKHPVEVIELIAASDDAYAALWRYLLELDLVHEVVAVNRSVDEPVRFMVADARAVQTRSVTDHLWARILDLPRCLEGRTWQQAGRLVLDVADPLDFASGRIALDVDADGRATVSSSTENPDITLGVAALSSVLLGGASPITLAAAGRLAGEPTAVERLSRMAVTPTPPTLGFWF